MVGDFTLLAQGPGLTSALSTPFKMLPAPLTITANDQTKPYGTTFTFAGTEFTVSGLVPGDTVDSVSLPSAGRPGHRDRRRQPVPDHPVRRRSAPVSPTTRSPTSPGELTVTPATAVIAVTGYTVPYDGLPHTATGTATGVLGEDLSADLDLSATTHTAAGSTRRRLDLPRPGRQLRRRQGTVTDTISAGDPDHHRHDQTKPYGTTFTFAGTEFTVSGLQGTDSVTSVTLDQRRRAGHRHGRRQPVPDHPSAAVGTGLANYTITYVDGALTVTAAAADDHRRRPDQAVRHDVHLRRHRVHDDRPAERRHRRPR